jgi:DNA processing protein
MASTRFASDTDGFLACHRLALAALPTIRLKALLDVAGGDPGHALTLGGDPRAGLTSRQSQRLAEAARTTLTAKARTDAERLGIYALLSGDSAYPALLSPLDDAPPLLFVRGTLPSQTGVALVGSRRASVYGRSQAARFAAALVEAGLGVVSGGAAGVDAAAHQAALEAGGATVAVVACGLDISYPAQNRGLFDAIAGRGGAVVSEYPLGTTPEPWRFPARNRIIAGICPLTLVIEAPETSGALITARNAAEYGREVFVLPGPVDSGRSRGGHKLIQDGASLADSPDDVLAALDASPMVAASSPPTPELDGDEALLYAQLSRVPRHLDEAAEAAGLSSPQAAVAATLLEMKKLVQREPGGFFARV